MSVKHRTFTLSNIPPMKYSQKNTDLRLTYKSTGCDVQRTFATACKLHKGATFAKTSDGYSVQNVPSATGWNVSDECLTCDCPMFTTTMLPCKHVSMTRLHCSMCLDKASIHDRWLRSIKCASDVSGSVSLTQKTKKKPKRLTK